MDSAQENKLVLMTTTPVEKLVLKLAVPTIISMLISSLYNMADTYFVGQIGTSATAGVGVCMPLMAIIQAMGFFFGHGSGNYLSRQLGANNMEQASKMAATGVVTAWLGGGVLALLGSVFMGPLALLLGSTPTVLPHTTAYLRFILLGAPWMCASLVLNNLLRFQGSAYYGMLGMTSGAILNVGLDPLLIFVFDMGVAGAALATMISQMVSCIILFVGCTKGGNVSIRLRNYTPRLFIFLEIARGGLPSLIRQSLASVSIILLNQSAREFGDAAIAAMSVVNRVTMFAGSALIGFGQGFQPVCGFNYGAKLYGRVRKAFFFCVRVAAVLLCVVAAVGFAFAPEVIAIFRRDDPEVIRIGAYALRAAAITFPTVAWVVLCNMMLQTMGLAGRASILAVGRQGVFLISALLLLVPRLGLTGLQIAQPCSDIATFLLALPLGLYTLGELKRLQEAQEAREAREATPDPVPPEP